MADLALIQTFVTVYRVGNMTAAARLLNVTQPAVSKQIQAFEAQVSRTLFTRLARGLAATEAAHALASMLAPHVDGLEASLAAHDAGTDGLAGVVMIGGPAEFLGAAALPSLRSAIERGISVRAEPGVPPDLLSSLANGAIDLAICTQRRPTRGVRFESLYIEDFVLVAAPQWSERLPESAVIERGAGLLADVPLLAYDDSLPIIRRYWREVFGTPPPRRASVIVPNLRSLASVAVAGLGITVLPRYLIADELRRGTLVLLAPVTNGPTNTIWLASRVGDSTPRTAFVCETLRRAARLW